MPAPQVDDAQPDQQAGPLLSIHMVGDTVLTARTLQVREVARFLSEWQSNEARVLTLNVELEDSGPVTLHLAVQHLVLVSIAPNE
jgi:hypothetical protein